jgi:hypothetical protein
MSSVSVTHCKFRFNNFLLILLFHLLNTFDLPRVWGCSMLLEYLPTKLGDFVTNVGKDSSTMVSKWDRNLKKSNEMYLNQYLRLETIVFLHRLFSPVRRLQSPLISNTSKQNPGLVLCFWGVLHMLGEWDYS